MKFQDIQQQLETNKKLLYEEYDTQVEQLLHQLFSEIKTPITGIGVLELQARPLFCHDPCRGRELIKDVAPTLKRWIEFGSPTPVDFAQHRIILQEIAYILDTWVNESGGRSFAI